MSGSMETSEQAVELGQLLQQIHDLIIKKE